MMSTPLLSVLLICLLSASLTAMLTALGERCRKSRSSMHVYSASVGLLLFGCVKGMLIDCGWEYAALLGITAGLTAQICVTAGAMVFFRELRSENWLKSRTVCAVSLLCFGVGRHLMFSAAPWTDLSGYLTGEGVVFAVVTVSLMRLHREEATDSRLRGATAVGATLIKAAFCAVWRQSEDSAFLGAVLLTLGLTGMIGACVQAMQRRHSLSGSGFAAGFLTALCIASLPVTGG